MIKKSEDILIKDFEKLKSKYEKKAQDIKDGLERPFIEVQDQKVYTMEELFDFWESGSITSSTIFERHEEKLKKLLKEYDENKDVAIFEETANRLEKLIAELKSEKLDGQIGLDL